MCYLPYPRKGYLKSPKDTYKKNLHINLSNSRLCQLSSSFYHPGGWILGRNSDKVLIFSSYSQSPLQLCLEISISSNSCNLLCISSNSLITYFNSSVNVHCKGERRKTWCKTIRPSLWFNKSIHKPQVWELSRLCTEASTKLYVHEFGFSRLWVKPRLLATPKSFIYSYIYSLHTLLSLLSKLNSLTTCTTVSWAFHLHCHQSPYRESAKI